jgi:hypothetical protein
MSFRRAQIDIANVLYFAVRIVILFLQPMVTTTDFRLIPRRAAPHNAVSRQKS